MWFWMYATRIPAIQELMKKKIIYDPKKSIGSEYMNNLPYEVRWVADNFVSNFEIFTKTL
jgi:hypothetical protein